MKQRPSELNRQYLHTRLRYESGKLFWREKPEKDNRTGWNKKYAGKEAGGINDDGYWKIESFFFFNFFKREFSENDDVINELN